MTGRRIALTRQPGQDLAFGDGVVNSLGVRCRRRATEALGGRHDRFTKRRFFQRHGVPAYWIIDPDGDRSRSGGREMTARRFATTR